MRPLPTASGPPAVGLLAQLQSRPGASWLIAGAAGALTGGFAAWAYYDDLFRSLAHAFGLWILTTALLSVRQPPVRAAFRCVLSLEAAVLTFFVGKKVMYGVDYPGMPYAINRSELVEWLILAVVAGVLLGLAFHRIGTTGRAGALATAAAVGLIVGDAYRRSRGYADIDLVLVLFAVPAVVAVLVAGCRSRRQLLEMAAWVAPAAVLGVVLVSLPDLLEQLLITGLP